MSRILIHTPLNIRKNLIDALKAFLKDFNRKHGMQIGVETVDHSVQGSWLADCVAQNDIPDMVLAHATDYATVDLGKLSDVFASFPNRFPPRPELQPYGDDAGILHPVFGVPFVIICNTRLVNPEDRPSSWEELMASRWHGRLAFPDPTTPIARGVASYINSCYPGQFQDFLPHLKFVKSVPELNQAVGDGVYPLGIANIAFAKMLHQRHVVPIWPKEGAVLIPQFMAWSNRADKSLLEIGDFMLSKPVQAIFANQGFVPANPELPLSNVLTENCGFVRLEEWERYSENIRKVCELL
ncbi:MAG: ABC transporter substrate-binding protein [Syntrophomonadaceae bacterium]